MQAEIKDACGVDYLRTDYDGGRHLDQLLSAELKEAYILSLPYGAVIWHDDSFLPLDTETGDKIIYEGHGRTIEEFRAFCQNCRYPVGVVLKGVFEVWREQKIGSAKRSVSNTLLMPGGMFGLFESLAGLHGKWYITSGVKTFFVSNSIGDSKYWGTNTHHVEALKHTRTSTYDHYKLLDGLVDIKSWNSQCLIFDLHTIKDHDLRERFYKKTIEQLVQVVHQHPQLGFCDSEEFDHTPVRQTARTLDGMIEGHIPVYTLATDQDREYLPYDELHERLTKYLRNAGRERKNEPIDIWIPCLLGPSRKVGAHFKNKGKQFWQRDAVQDLFYLYPRDRSEFKRVTEGRLGRLVTLDDTQVLEWTTQNNKRARIRTYKRNISNGASTKNIEDIQKIIAVFTAHRNGELGYMWPKHMHSGFVIELIDDLS